MSNTTTTNILNFLDVLNNYSKWYLVVTGEAALILWIIYSRHLLKYYECKTSIPSIVLSAISISFDLTSGAANWIVPNPINKVYAIGSALHSIATSMQIALIEEEFGRYAALLLWFGEVLELGAITLTLNITDIKACSVILVIGIVVSCCCRCRCVCNLIDGSLTTNNSSRDEDGSTSSKGAQQIQKYFIACFQITYIGIVVIAAFTDWTRLLWLLPEVPFETISLFISRPKPKLNQKIDDPISSKV